MNSPKPMSHPRLIGALPALGLLTSIAFAIAAGVASVARAAPPPQCPPGTVLNAVTHACTLVKAPAAAAPAASTPVLKVPVTTAHPPANSGNAATTCNGHGSVTSNGSCSCNAGYGGSNCNSCAVNYYGYPTCQYALASSTCNGNGVVAANGSCSCNAGYTGSNCNYCAPNYYGYPACQTKTPQ
jgi:hypothetical protein